MKNHERTLPSFGCEKFFSLSPPRVGLLFLNSLPLVLGHRLPELTIKSMEYPKAFFQFERVHVFAEEIREDFPHVFQLTHSGLEVFNVPFCHLHRNTYKLEFFDKNLSIQVHILHKNIRILVFMVILLKIIYCSKYIW